MYRRKLLPEGAAPPETVRGDGFLMRPLRLADAEADYAAVMATQAQLRGWMDPDDPWPEGLTLHENRVDLGWHEREFTLGHSFAWTVIAPEGARTDDAPEGARPADAPEGPHVLGCAYLYPSDRAGYAAMAFWWARKGAADLDGAIGAVFREMLAVLPLAPIAFPGRDIGWEAWRALPRP